MDDNVVTPRMRIDAVFIAYCQGDASSIDLANAMRQHWAEANKAHQIAHLKAGASLANNLCQDHRDKQAGKPCLACELESAESSAMKWENAATLERTLKASAEARAQALDRALRELVAHEEYHAASYTDASCNNTTVMKTKARWSAARALLKERGNG